MPARTEAAGRQSGLEWPVSAGFLEVSCLTPTLPAAARGPGREPIPSYDAHGAPAATCGTARYDGREVS